MVKIANKIDADLDLHGWITTYEAQIRESKQSGYPMQYYIKYIRGIFGSEASLSQIATLTKSIEMISELDISDIQKSFADLELRNEALDKMHSTVKVHGDAALGISKNDLKLNRTLGMENYIKSMKGRFITIDTATHKKELPFNESEQE